MILIPLGVWSLQLLADLALPTCPFVGMVGSELYDGSSLKEIQRAKGKRGQRFVDAIVFQTLSTIHFPDRGFWAPRPLGMRSFADCRAIWLHQQQWTLLSPDTRTHRETRVIILCAWVLGALHKIIILEL